MNIYNYPKQYDNNFGKEDKNQSHDSIVSSDTLPLKKAADGDAISHPRSKILLAFVFFVCFGSLTAFYMKVTDTSSAPSWSVLIYLVPISIAFYWFLVNPVESIKYAMAGLPLMLLVTWAFLSFKWSKQPDVSLKQGLLFCLTYMIAATFAARYKWRSFNYIIVIIIAFQSIVSIILAVLLPRWGVMHSVYPGAWSGIWHFKQTFGINMALGVAIVSGYALTYKNTRVICAFLLAIMFCNSLESEATTAVIVSTLSVIIACTIYFARLNVATALITIWSTVVIATVSIVIMQNFSDELFAAIGKSPNLTGRTYIWQAMEYPISQRPLHGWGFQAFWTDESLSSPIDWIEKSMKGYRPPDAHSTSRDITVQLGLVGLALATLTFIQMWFCSIVNCLTSKGGIIIMAYTCAWSTISFTEALSLYPMDFATFLFQAIFIKSSMEVYEKIYAGIIHRRKHKML